MARFRPTDPLEAQEIAAHAMMVMRIMRDADSLDVLDRHYRVWLSYADQKSVCSAIRDHLKGVVSEVGAALKAASKASRVVRDPSGAAA